MNKNLEEIFDNASSQAEYILIKATELYEHLQKVKNAENNKSAHFFLELSLSDISDIKRSLLQADIDNLNKAYTHLANSLTQGN